MNSAQRTFAADRGVDPSLWRRVHIITPLLEVWQIIVAVIAFATVLNLNELQEAMNAGLGNAIMDRLFLVALVSILVIAFLVLYTFLQWRVTAYALTDSALWFRKGILNRNQRHARLDRIQAVDITQPVLARLVGLGKLDVEVAGGSDSNITIGFLKVSELEALRGEILARAAGLKMAAQSPSQASAMGGQGYAAPYGAPQAASPYAPTQAPYGSAQSTQAPYSPVPQGQYPQAPAMPAQPGAMPQPANFSYTGEVFAPSTIPVAPERELYQVPMGRLLGSQLLSMSALVSVLALIVIIVIGAASIPYIGLAGITASLGGVAMVGLSVASFHWNRFASEANFRLAISPDGLRLRRGLLSTRSQTIPPRRIHAIEIQQPFLWRFFGWYRVLILQAGYGAKDTDQNKQQSSHVLIPVGTRRDVNFALWAVIEDLGVDDIQTFVDAALAGTGDGNGFVRMSARAFILDPFLFKRRARAITRTTFVVRDGWLTRKSFWAPIARLQSVSVKAGPLERALGVATLHMHLVPGPFTMKAEHQDATQVSADLETLLHLGHVTRASEPPEKWMLRMENGVRSGFETSPVTQ